MIDLHSHILPQLCDGSQSLETSLAMARLAVADGTTHLACTPHIYPGVYANSTATIAPALEALQHELDVAGIPLRLVMGADVHMVPEVMTGLKHGVIPTLNGSRYFLLEPSHHVPVPGFLEQVQNFLHAGYVPVITHPERLRWLDGHYADFVEAARLGAWIQVTAGAIAGRFGPGAERWSERFLKDGLVHIIASDAHSIDHRPPVMSPGIEAAIHLTGNETDVWRMVRERPQWILDNGNPDEVAIPPGLDKTLAIHPEVVNHSKKGWFSRLFS